MEAVIEAVRCSYMRQWWEITKNKRGKYSCCKCFDLYTLIKLGDIHRINPTPHTQGDTFRALGVEKCPDMQTDVCAPSEA